MKGEIQLQVKDSLPRLFLGLAKAWLVGLGVVVLFWMSLCLLLALASVLFG
jgi:hypothetical protein